MSLLTIPAPRNQIIAWLQLYHPRMSEDDTGTVDPRKARTVGNHNAVDDAIAMVGISCAAAARRRRREGLSSWLSVVAEAESKQPSTLAIEERFRVLRAVWAVVDAICSLCTVSESVGLRILATIGPTTAGRERYARPLGAGVRMCELRHRYLIFCSIDMLEPLDRGLGELQSGCLEAILGNLAWDIFAQPIVVCSVLSAA